jgi:hypothetical protein
MLKHGLTVLSIILEHAQDWDDQLPRILFGYRCGVQSNTKFSPHMLQIDRTPILKVDDFLSPLVQTFKEGDNPTVMAKQMISKMQLISKMHGEVTRNSIQAQARQKRAYAS